MAFSSGLTVLKKTGSSIYHRFYIRAFLAEFISTFAILVSSLIKMCYNMCDNVCDRVTICFMQRILQGFRQRFDCSVHSYGWRERQWSRSKMGCLGRYHGWNSYCMWSIRFARWSNVFKFPSPEISPLHLFFDNKVLIPIQRFLFSTHLEEFCRGPSYLFIGQRSTLELFVERQLSLAYTGVRMEMSFPFLCLCQWNFYEPLKYLL